MVEVDGIAVGLVLNDVVDNKYVAIAFSQFRRSPEGSTALFTSHADGVVGDVDVFDFVTVELEGGVGGVERREIDDVVGDEHRCVGRAFELSQVDDGGIGDRSDVEDVTRDFGGFGIFVAQLHIEDSDTDLGSGIGVDGDGVVANLHTEFVHDVDGLCAVVAERITLDDATHFLGQCYVAGSAHAHTNLTTFEQTAANGEVVVVAVLLVDDGMVDECDVARRGRGSVEIAIVDGDVAALVLHHDDGLIGNVGCGDFQVAQRDIAGFVEGDDAIVLLVLVVAVATGGVLVVIDLDIALSAFALEGEGVD